ncbi:MULTISPECIES: hypothetical protein [Oceanobacillus]|uniref:hypothetical protein n=1 Tax=Oceanobacillus TaxID=182709 RepID=UPI002F96B592
MSEKSADEIAAELTIALLEHNSKLVRANGQSTNGLDNATGVAKDFYFLREVVRGNVNPYQEKKQKSD